MTREDLNNYTHNGDCDRCGFGIEGGCHLQCTHEECDDDYEKRRIENGTVS